MQTDTVGSFYSSVMIICIHNDNLLIPKHRICIHDFKKHFNNLSILPSLAFFIHKVVSLCVEQLRVLSEKIHVSSSQEEIWQHQFQKIYHPLLFSWFLPLVAIILVLCGKNHWQL